MKFTYEDLISGEPIFVEGIGHFRSPLLSEIKPNSGIGMWEYNLYLNILSWEKDTLVKIMGVRSSSLLSKIQDNDKISCFDAITLNKQLKELLLKAMTFFIQETITWDEKSHGFITKKDGEETITGYINRDNFEDVKDMILQLNYIGLGKSSKPTGFASEKARKLWERAQKYLKEDAKRTPQDKKMSLGNIISKLSVASNSYNLFNIYNLTIFQLYDQFFQYGYLRATELNERAYSIHGGKGFDMQGWLKPISK